MKKYIFLMLILLIGSVTFASDYSPVDVDVGYEYVADGMDVDLFTIEKQKIDPVLIEPGDCLPQINEALYRAETTTNNHWSWIANLPPNHYIRGRTCLSVGDIHGRSGPSIR